MAETIDRTQRCTQIMRHRVGEGFQFLIGRFKCRSAFGNYRFQMMAVSFQFLFGLLALGYVVKNDEMNIAVK